LPPVPLDRNEEGKDAVSDSESSEEGDPLEGAAAAHRERGDDSLDEDEMHLLLASVQDNSPRTSGHIVNCAGVEDATITSEPVSRSLFGAAKRKGARIILPMV